METKGFIKSKIREAVGNTNILGVEITRPDQELTIMRGVPGSGKSTEAKKQGAGGAVHSTDDVIESKYDYRKFFADMIANKNFGPLSNAHNQNFKNAVSDMKKGVSPVVIDNTNIKADEPKNYIEAALKMGYDDKNIHFIEVGDGGVSAEELAQRNTHGVPLDKIKQMLQSMKSVGPLTVEKVLNAKSRFGNKQSKIAMFVLDDNSHAKLIEATKQYIPEGWKIFAHHMTINFGKGLPEDLKGDLDTKKFITATEIGVSDMAIAVKVEGYHSDNDIPHVTVAVNTAEGGKPVMSNKITNWQPLDSYISLTGYISEQKLG
jgi:predicted kinase